MFFFIKQIIIAKKLRYDNTEQNSICLYLLYALAHEISSRLDYRLALQSVSKSAQIFGNGKNRPGYPRPPFFDFQLPPYGLPRSSYFDALLCQFGLNFTILLRKYSYLLQLLRSRLSPVLNRTTLVVPLFTVYAEIAHVSLRKIFCASFGLSTIELGRFPE